MWGVSRIGVRWGTFQDPYHPSCFFPPLPLVQSPDTCSSKSSPPLSAPLYPPTTMDPTGRAQSLGRSYTSSPVDSLIGGRMSQLPMPSPLGGMASVADRVGGSGQNLVDVMSSKFIPGQQPMGNQPMGNQPDAYNSTLVKNVSVV